MRRLAPISVPTALYALTLLGGCGGASAPNYPQNVTVAISPTVASLAAGSTQQFTATVANYTGTASFFVEPSTAPAGSITSTGLYTAPTLPPIINYGGATGTQGVVTVEASVLYPSAGTFIGSAASTSQTLVITAPTITAGFLPATATVPLGTTYKFQPYAVGSTNRAYTLQVNGLPGGSVSTGTIVSDTTNAGLYTAPSIMPMTGSTVTLTVISQADPTRTGTATITLK